MEQSPKFVIQDRIGRASSGTDFSLWGSVLANTNPHRLKSVPSGKISDLSSDSSILPPAQAQLDQHRGYRNHAKSNRTVRAARPDCLVLHRRVRRKQNG